MSWKGNVFCNFLQTFVPGNTLKLNPADSFRLVKESAVISDIPALSSQIAAAQQYIMNGKSQHKNISAEHPQYESFATVGEIRVYWRADFQSGSRVLKKVF